MRWTYAFGDTYTVGETMEHHINVSVIFEFEAKSLWLLKARWMQCVV